jgi:hypothetical protein
MGGLRTNRKLGIASVEPLAIFYPAAERFTPKLVCPRRKYFYYGRFSAALVERRPFC